MKEEYPAAWYVLRTQVKRERVAAANLGQLEEVETFLPRIRYLKTTRRGKIWWVEALFPGYLLAKFDHYNHSRLVTSVHGVSKIVAFGKNTPEVPAAFVEALKEEVEKYQDDAGDIVVGWKLLVGQEVEIGEGPFKGLEGKVLEIRPSVERVSLLLGFFGEEKPVELSLSSLILSGQDIPQELKTNTKND
jgi:transcriptional antiterminator RfaH